MWDRYSSINRSSRRWRHSVSKSHVITCQGEISADHTWTAPYTSNNQTLTLNSEDDILSSETDGSDPFVEYVQLSNNLSDGIMAWITIGIDPTVDDAVNSAATYYADGGVANEDSGIGMPSGGNRSMSGLPPSTSGVTASMSKD